MSLKLKKIYISIKESVDRRLREFKSIWEDGDDKAVFREMCFCMCTPQNNAKKAWGAVLSLESTGCLYKTQTDEIARVLRAEGVRFHNNKAKHIMLNTMSFYPDTKKHLQEILKDKQVIEARNFLAKHIAGWGLKEASHFLRNIGFGDSLCILDRHILRQLLLYGVIPLVPETVSQKTYLDIEQAMLAFAKKTAIPPDALDLLFWYQEKGELFK
jgi:N-glycosylase/DNA lyase